MRRLRLVVFTLVVGAAACGQGDGTIDRRFDVCDPIALDGDPARGVDDAIALWSAEGVTTLVTGAGVDTIPIVFESAGPATHGFYDDVDGVIYINVDLDADPAARAITIAHELGHAFGLVHVEPDERVSLMNPHNLTVAPTVEDARALELLWGRCDR